MRVAVCTAAWNQPYIKGLNRLVQSLDKYAPDIPLISAVDPSWPKHSEAPFAFKHHALLQAQDLGYDGAIWCDSNAHFLKHPAPIINQIADKGYWLCTLGWNVGQWCTDEALVDLQITRDEAWDITMACAAVYGVRFNSPVAQQLLHYLKDNEKAMVGPVNNANNAASHTEGVMGHRHDQTVLSVGAHMLKLDLDRPPCMLDYAYNSGTYPKQAVCVKEGLL